MFRISPALRPILPILIGASLMLTLTMGLRQSLGLFMPSALGLIFVMLAVPSVQVQQLLSPAMLVLVFVMVIDGFVLGRKVNRMVDEKFPDNTETGWKLGFYAASRASQLRRMRAPRPQVERGASVG